MTRFELLWSQEVRDHPGTMQIHGYDINMSDIVEVRAALFWVSMQTSQMMRSMRDEIVMLKQQIDNA